MNTLMRHCNQCGGGLALAVPAGDSLSRHVCADCGHIHYQNPKVITGTIPVWEDRILLCRRAIEPRKGLWTLPAGFLEIGETSAQGAARETREEAGASVEIGMLFSLINVTYIGQLYLWYLAEMVSPEFSAGAESEAVELLTAERIPWDELAFPTVNLALKDFLADREQGRFQFHSHDLTVPPWTRRQRKADLE